MSRPRLLLDENLSESILRAVSETCPDSDHVRLALLAGATDEQVWAHARDHGFVLVTRDEDFERLSALRGAPPKVIWLAFHNATNTEVVNALRYAHASIDRFVRDPAAALLVIDHRPEARDPAGR